MTKLNDDDLETVLKRLGTLPEQRKALDALKKKYHCFDRESLRMELMPLVAEMYEVPIIKFQDGYKLNSSAEYYEAARKALYRLLNIITD
jgi:hypothetical protein